MSVFQINFYASNGDVAVTGTPGPAGETALAGNNIFTGTDIFENGVIVPDSTGALWQFTPTTNGEWFSAPYSAGVPTDALLSEDGLHYFVSEDGLHYLTQEA